MNEHTHHRHEPFVRIAKRSESAWYRSLAVRAAAILLAFAASALIIYAITKLNPIKVFKAMFAGAFGTEKRIWVTLRDAMMLLCVSIGLAPAFKMRFWNIGAEGQILVGGIATAACMIYLKDLPTPLLFAAMVVASLIAGALWGLIPAIFKAKWNTNETLFTLMMNYVAIQITSFFVAKWEHPFGSNTVGIINQAKKQGWFPKVFGQQYMLNLLIVLAIAVLMFLYLKYTKQGYEIAVVGESENTARYAGINVRTVIIRTMLISGAICGIAGFIAVSGSSHTISTSTAGGDGFTAIIVAWLSKFNSFVMIAVSMLLSFLERGAVQIASDFGLNEYVSKMITGVILFFILGSEFFINYRLVFRHSNPKGGKKA